MHHRSTSGFSLVEVLIVMAILAVLVGGVLVIIGYSVERTRSLQTTQTVAQATILIQDWRGRFSHYPPSAMTRMERIFDEPCCTRQPVNGTNEGIETVFQALYWPGFDTPAQWQPEQLGNTDDDRLEKPVNGTGSLELTEIVDAWGNPLVYFASDEYARYEDGGARYRRGAVDVEPRPHRLKDGSFARPRSFQVFSMGPDGVPNTPDDVVNWGR